MILLQNIYFYFDIARVYEKKFFGLRRWGQKKLSDNNTYDVYKSIRSILNLKTKREWKARQQQWIFDLITSKEIYSVREDLQKRKIKFLSSSFLFMMPNVMISSKKARDECTCCNMLNMRYFSRLKNYENVNATIKVYLTLYIVFS